MGNQTTKKKTKPDSARLNLFYIIYVLKKYSNENNLLSIKEIMELVNTEFKGQNENIKTISKETVRRSLLKLIQDFYTSKFKYDFNDGEPETITNDTNEVNNQKFDYNLGFYIYCVVKNKDNKYIHYEPFDEEPDEDESDLVKELRSANFSAYFFYYKSFFSLPDIKMLIDAVETQNYLEVDDISNIINNLYALQPKTFDITPYEIDSTTNREIKSNKSKLLENINSLTEKIKKEECVKISYSAYDSNKQLKVRNGYPKIIEPIHIMSSNGYNYLLAYASSDHDTPFNYRIDKIESIEEVSIDEKGKTFHHSREKLNPSVYRLNHPIMFGGVEERITLLCKETKTNYIMNTIMDVFGKKATITRPPESELKKIFKNNDGTFFLKENERWLRISIESAPGGVELWATQYCKDCIIIEREDSAKRIRDNLKTALAYYDSLL